MHQYIPMHTRAKRSTRAVHLPRGARDPTPVRIVTKDRGFDERRRDNCFCDSSGSCIVSRPAHRHLDQARRAFSVPRYGLCEPLRYSASHRCPRGSANLAWPLAPSSLSTTAPQSRLQRLQWKEGLTCARGTCSRAVTAACSCWASGESASAMGVPPESPLASPSRVSFVLVSPSTEICNIRFLTPTKVDYTKESFYVTNIASSPSVVMRRWLGQDLSYASTSAHSGHLIIPTGVPIPHPFVLPGV